MSLILLAVAAALIPLILLALARLRSLRRRVQALEADRGELERDAASARAALVRGETEWQLLSRFVRDLPHVVHELHAGAGARHIPNLLLNTVTRAFEPRKALVAVRRQPVEGDPERRMRLAVAAVSPPGWIEIGSEIRIGRGEIGFPAEVQRVMDRRDFESQPPAERKRLREETAAGCEPDVVAPMIFKEETVGVIAIEGGRPGVKDALRLLAQLGAASIDTQARYVEMKATASVDGLTGIFNKRYLNQRLGEELQKAIDAGSTLSVFIFDVDHFKRYNDRNGHVAGDRLLREIAKVVQGCVRRDAVFGRYGGEEFLIMLPGARRDQALAAAENVRYAVANYPFAQGSVQPLGIVSISGGVAEGPRDGLDAASLVSAADEALYRAKGAGRNKVLPHTPRYLSDDTQDAPGPGEGDFTPEPGVLLSLASITPAGGMPVLTAQPSAEVLAAALEAHPPEPASPAGPAAPERAKEPRLVVVQDEMAERASSKA